ncbi:MAG: CPBP family intramembrane metalloprotease [Candidatus Methanomethylophilaceae archaeon]|nr:CPBP family intramembrane metalloprotease [Candidatus Methanomethylophilaceae archaeon]
MSGRDTMILDFRDPNGKPYVICTLISVAVMLAASVIFLIYLVVAAPSEAYVLTTGDEPIGIVYPLVCAAVFVLSLVLLVKDLAKRMKGCPEEEKDARFMRAPASKAGILFSITAFTSLAMVLFSYLIGEEITEDFISNMDTYEIMVSMMCAGPEEEFICRLLMIGLPVTLICLVKGHTNCAKYLFGGFGMSKAALVFLFISSVAFGLLHLGGWSIMKFPDTFISGMLFGYVYIQYGIHASIVMHSSFDLLASFDFFFDGAGTFPVVFMSILGIVLTVRSLLKIRTYIPENMLHEPFEGSLIEMWERD